MHNLVAFVTFDFCANWKWKCWESINKCSHNVSSHPGSLFQGFKTSLDGAAARSRLKVIHLGVHPRSSRCFCFPGKQHRLAFHIFRAIYEVFLIMNMHLCVLQMHILLELCFSVTLQLRNRFFSLSIILNCLDWWLLTLVLTNSFENMMVITNI